MDDRDVTSPSYADRRIRPKNGGWLLPIVLATACARSGGEDPATARGSSAHPTSTDEVGPERRADPERDVSIVVSDGRRVDIDKHRVLGKITVVDFYATWCAPCRYVDEWLALQQRRHGDIAIRRVNVVDWDSPVARQYLRDDSPELPYLVVFDPEGRRIAEVYGGRISQLRATFARVRAAEGDTPP